MNGIRPNPFIDTVAQIPNFVNIAAVTAYLDSVIDVEPPTDCTIPAIFRSQCKVLRKEFRKRFAMLYDLEQGSFEETLKIKLSIVPSMKRSHLMAIRATVDFPTESGRPRTQTVQSEEDYDEGERMTIHGQIIEEMLRDLDQSHPRDSSDSDTQMIVMNEQATRLDFYSGCFQAFWRCGIEMIGIE
jgi:hypothetical protein